jgi:hypothetical protein
MEWIGIAIRKDVIKDLKGVLYPCVGLRSQGSSIKVNFGNGKFKYVGIFYFTH